MNSQLATEALAAHVLSVCSSLPSLPGEQLKQSVAQLTEVSDIYMCHHLPFLVICMLCDVKNKQSGPVSLEALYIGGRNSECRNNILYFRQSS